MPRLGHKKSRNGCRQCKARHVKCDESKPCSNCARHGVQCSLVTWDPNAPPPPPAAAPESSNAPKRVPKTLAERPRNPSTQSPSVGSDHTLNLSGASGTGTGTGTSEGSSPRSGNDPFPYLTKFVNRGDTGQPNYWVRDLELLHHWTIETHLTISQRDDVRYMWRVIAPKQAVTHTFLMHEILAFAAFHLAAQQPEQRRIYYALGVHHQDLAIRAMRKMLQGLSPDNAGALFATSAVMTLSVFASTGLECVDPLPNTVPRHPIEGILDIFSLIQGMGGVLSSAQSYVTEGPFSPIFRDPIEATPDQPLLGDLHAHIPPVLTYLESRIDLDEETRGEYIHAMSFFKDTLAVAMGPLVDNRELRFLFYWPLGLGPNFFVRLRERDSGTLMILMYYATGIYMAEEHYWLFDGWADRLMRAALEAIDPSWLPIVQWPLSLMASRQDKDEFGLQYQQTQMQTQMQAQDIYTFHNLSLQEPGPGAE